MEEAKKEYDIVIFDSPPILSTADAAILGAKVDGVLLVYRVGSVSKGLLKRSVTQLQQVKSNILGVILNGMRPEVSPDFQDYKYYSYYYSYGEEDKDKRRRDLKKGWAFLGRKGKGEPREEGKPSLEEEERGAQKQEGKKVSGRRLLLLFVATAILAVGVLWHNNLIDPFKDLDKQGPVKKEETKPDAKTGVPSKTRIVKEPKSPSAKPKRPVSVDEPKMKTSIPEEQANSKTLIAAEPPSVKKDVLKEISKAKPQGPAGKPTDKASGGKRAIDIEAPLPQSQPVPNTPMGPETPIVAESSEPTPQGKPDVISKGPKIVASQERSVPPTEAKPVSEIEAPPSFNHVVSYPYSIRLGAFRTLKRAQKAVSHYDKKGLSPYWVKVEFDNKTWYRVYAGHFERRGQAEGFRRDHGLMDAMVKRTKYATLIHTNMSSEKLNHQLQSLKQLGYSPYVIEYDDGQSRVFAGTFVTKEGAEKQQQDLESKGVQSQVIER